MAFTKAFPKRTDKTVYPRWEDVTLTQSEEQQEEEKARKENIDIMIRCIEDSKKMFEERQLKPYQTDIVNTAISLFEKQASHSVYWKERKAKEKFDKQD